MNIKMLNALIDERKDELFKILCDLVKINSENFGDHGNEEECARFIHKLCQDMGLESDLYSPLDIDGFTECEDYYPGRNLEKRYNVAARWKGTEDKDELMLMGHHDTVPIGDPANWSFEPLLGEVRDGKILGRGACDDKYALATVMFLIKILNEKGFKPRANLVFASYSDEEFGGSHGAMASVMKYPCTRIVNLDGRYAQIWHCASGGGEMCFKYHTVNTVDSAKLTAQVIPIIMEEIDKFADNRSAELEENRFYKGTIIPKTSLRYLDVHAGNNGSDLGVGSVNFVFYTVKTKEEIYKELEEVTKRINERINPLGVVGDGFFPTTRYFHYGFSEPDHESINDMVRVAKDAIGEDVMVCGSCLSDLSVILKYGNNSAYGFGAGRDFSLPGGAHQPNEFIECESLVKFAKMVGAYMIDFLEEKI